MQRLDTKHNTYDKAISDIDSNVRSVSNFAFLKSENFKLAEFGFFAELYLERDPVTSIMKIGQFAELLALEIAEKKGLNIKYSEKQFVKIHVLKNAGVIDEKVLNIFESIREERNKASHPPFEGDSQTARTLLGYAATLGRWYYEELGQHQPDNHPLPVSPVAYLLFSQYQKTVAQLEATIANYEFINNQLQNLPNTIIDLQNKKPLVNSRGFFRCAYIDTKFGRPCSSFTCKILIDVPPW